MRHKNTVYSQEFHNQFSETEERVRKSKQKKAEGWRKEEKEGQSKYRINEATKKQSIG